MLHHHRVIRSRNSGDECNGGANNNDGGANNAMGNGNSGSPRPSNGGDDDDDGGDLSSMDISSFGMNPEPAPAAPAAAQQPQREGDQTTPALGPIDELGHDSGDGEDEAILPPPPPPRGLQRDASVATSVIALDVEHEHVAEHATSPAALGVGRAAAPASSASAGITIRLSEEEAHLFDTLAAAADMYERGELQIDDAKFRRINHEDGGGDVVGTSQSGAGGGVSSSASSSSAGFDLIANGNNGGDGPRRQPKQPIAIRVAGGWVRDKILDMHSHDVDVALDCMSGVHFATIVQAYLTHLERTGQIPVPDKVHKIGVISANPSQSKHLETATMKIFNIEVDFVNLRAEEVYESHSRIPTHQTRQFGTPLEDALRRDFTINSLFYNVRSRQVEDWTGRGIDDLLVCRKIVTPLDPHTTFHDDPLRVLRAIRFSVRYDMDLDDNLRAAAMSAEVHRSLHVKVSRERVGKELEGMLSGKGARPGRALDLIAQLKLAGSVFTFPPSADATVDGTLLGTAYNGSPTQLARFREMGWEEAAELIRMLPGVLESHAEELQREAEDAAAADDNTCDSTAATDIAGNVSQEGSGVVGGGGMSITSGGSLSSSPPSPHQLRRRILRLQSFSMGSSVDLRMLHLSVFLLPFRGLAAPDKKRRIQSVVTHMVKEGIKFKNLDCRNLELIMDNVNRVRSILVKLRQASIENQSETHDDDEFPVERLPKICRLETGLLLRDVKELWISVLLLATVAEMRSNQLRSPDGGSSEGSASGTDGVLQTARDFYRAVRAEGLDGCWRIRPLLDGRAIMSSLNLPKGPVVNDYIQAQIQWMLLNPNGSREECELHLHDLKRKREIEEGQEDEQNELTLGVSDGACSSPVLSSQSDKHLSKRRHVESMDLL